MSKARRIFKHRVGDDEWNRVYAALEPFVARFEPSNRLERMTDAVIKALRSTRSATAERD